MTTRFAFSALAVAAGSTPVPFVAEEALATAEGVLGLGITNLKFDGSVDAIITRGLPLAIVEFEGGLSMEAEEADASNC